MDYLTELPDDKSLIIIGQLVKTCAQQGGPLSKELEKLFLDGRYRELVDFNFDYTLDFDRDDFLYARQIQGFFSKQKDLDIGIDKEARAFETFMSAEKLCSETNERFRSGLSGVSPDVHAVLHYASR